jgi:hypothetical protein
VPLSAVPAVTLKCLRLPGAEEAALAAVPLFRAHYVELSIAEMRSMTVRLAQCAVVLMSDSAVRIRFARFWQQR